MDSKVVDAVVDEVGSDLIYYRLYDNQNGPIYSTPVMNVFKIVYHNGYEQIISASSVFNEELLKAVGGSGGKMRFAGGRLYLGFLLLAGSDIPEGGAVIMGIGAAGMGAGIPLICNGNKILKGIASDYNSRLSPDYKPNLTFGPCRSGVGFALNF